MSLNQQPVQGGSTSFNIPKVKKRVRGAMPAFHAGSFEGVIENRFDQLTRENVVARFWSKDESLWGEHPVGSISSFMGWCDVLDEMLENVQEIEEFSSQLLLKGYTDLVLIGMGGSSLAPLMFGEIFSNIANGLSVHVVDSTDAEAIKKTEEEIPLDTTVFILASKSGSTAEPDAIFDYFFAQCEKQFGASAGSRFIAITDPDTKLEKVAREKGFMKTFLNYPNVGGRFSALTNFGLLPASLAGIDISELLKRSIQLKVLSEFEPDLRENPGFTTGIALGELARHGKDKLTFIMPEEIRTFYLWLEQLIAESTGKHSKGLLPVPFRRSEKVASYSKDRVFVHYTYENRHDEHTDFIEELKREGYPVLTISLSDNYDLGREMFRWEMITAVVSSLLYVNPFDQPDVQSAKDNTKRYLAKLDESGKLPARKVSYKEDCLRFLHAGTNINGADIFKDFFNHVKPGDFISILAFINETEEHTHHLEDIATSLEAHYGVPVTVGYGPRYLHSTGQFHKGGPNKGHFIKIISEGMAELMIPGKCYGFSQFILAQALGDYESLVNNGRRVLRVDIGKNRKKGLLTLGGTIRQSLT